MTAASLRHGAWDMFFFLIFVRCAGSPTAKPCQLVTHTHNTTKQRSKYIYFSTEQTERALVLPICTHNAHTHTHIMHGGTKRKQAVTDRRT